MKFIKTKSKISLLLFKIEAALTKMNRNFFMYTDGRTGSSAICDEINNHQELVCWQELFTYGADVSDFEGASMADAPALEKDLELDVLYYEMFRTLSPPFSHGKQCLEAYFAYLATKAAEQNAKKFGFKLLYNHATHWKDEGLIALLLKREYKIIHNLRLDFVRKYISGAIASKTGVWNTKNKVSWSEKVVLDPDICRLRCSEFSIRYQKFDKDIRSDGFKVITVSYEHFLSNRDMFLSQIFEFLGSAPESVHPSDFKIVTPADMSKIIENYDQFKSLLKPAPTVEEFLAGS